MIECTREYPRSDARRRAGKAANPPSRNDKPAINGEMKLERPYPSPANKPGSDPGHSSPCERSPDNRESHNPASGLHHATATARNGPSSPKPSALKLAFCRLKCNVSQRNFRGLLPKLRRQVEHVRVDQTFSCGRWCDKAVGMREASWKTRLSPLNPLTTGFLLDFDIEFRDFIERMGLAWWPRRHGGFINLQQRVSPFPYRVNSSSTILVLPEIVDAISFTRDLIWQS
jgi:hypothetical protein